MSTAQLLRYMSPISFSTLKAGRQGEKKAPILQGKEDDKIYICYWDALLLPEVLIRIVAKSKPLLADYKSEGQWSTMCPCEDCE